MKTEGIFQFREFAIVASARTLRRDGELVSLNRRAFDVLLYLVQNPGRVLTLEELLKNVWSDTFVDENSLAQSMSALRRALDEKPGDNTYIVTLPGRGYQFTAEKLEREALTDFRLIGAKRAEARDLGNIAILVENRGDLTGAIQLYQQSMTVDPEDTGRAALARLNIAGVHQLQGDLAGARQGFEQSISAFRDMGDKETTGDATSGLASVLLQEDDLPGARKMYEQALAIRTAASDKLNIAEVQLGMAELSLQEARPPADQEPAIRKDIESFQQQKVRDDEIAAWCLLTRVLLAENKISAAREAAQHARTLAVKSQNPEFRWRAAIAAAHVAASDNAAARSPAGIAARKELGSVIAKSHQLGYRIVELDARFALAEIEMKSGQTAEARAQLTAIEADAKATGYLLLARKAASARGQIDRTKSG